MLQRVLQTRWLFRFCHTSCSARTHGTSGELFRSHCVTVFVFESSSGRKNWLFSDTPAGAHASARIYGIIKTAKANGHKPYAYLCRILCDLPKAKTIEDFEALLPWKLDPGDNAGGGGVVPSASLPSAGSFPVLRAMAKRPLRSANFIPEASFSRNSA